jgi:membrane protein involved in colicin uptake
MLDSQEIIISIDERLAQARKEIASLEAALKAMSKRRANGGAPAPALRRSKGTAKGETKAATAEGTPAKAEMKAATAETTPAKAETKAAPAKTTRAHGPKSRSRATRRAKSAKRTDVVPAGKLVSLLGAGGGMSTADLVGQTGGDRQQLLTLLRELEAAGEVRRSGERRNTRWHVITDEDRIAARVAELERARARKPKAA